MHIYEVFCEDVCSWTFIDNDFFFLFLELSVHIGLCKSWFNVGAATMFHTWLKGHFEKYVWIVAKQKKEFVSTVEFLLILYIHILLYVILLWMWK
jgi:hypothetical protein